MSKLYSLIFAVIAVFGQINAQDSVQHISAEKLKFILENEPEDWKVIYVLSRNSFNRCHIKGSENVSIMKLEKESKSWGKDQKIVLYCGSKSCHASENAYQLLERLGFTNLYDYKNGMKGWKQKKYSVEGRDC